MNSVERGAVAWFVVSTIALVAPVYTAIGNSIEPRVLGLPWSLVYVLVVVAVTTGVLAWLYIARKVDSAEHDEGP